MKSRRWLGKLGSLRSPSLRGDLALLATINFNLLPPLVDCSLLDLAGPQAVHYEIINPSCVGCDKPELIRQLFA